MKKFLKLSAAVKGLATLCLFVILLSGCNSSSSSETTVDTSATTVDTSSTMMAPADTTMKTDTMPAVDSGTSTRPDGRKTKQ